MNDMKTYHQIPSSNIAYIDSIRRLMLTGKKLNEIIHGLQLDPVRIKYMIILEQEQAKRIVNFINKEEITVKEASEILGYSERMINLYIDNVDFDFGDVF
jgi:hypothetical protein